MVGLQVPATHHLSIFLDAPLCHPSSGNPIFDSIIPSSVTKIMMQFIGLTSWMLVAY